MKLSQLNKIQKQHLAWRLDHKTSCGLITAIRIAKGKLGDLELVDVFKQYGDKTEHAAKIHARKVMNFAL